jgi:hypothetical protein
MSGVFLGPGRLKTSRVTSVTANVDMPPPRELNVALIEEKSSFIIGSPPSSSDGGSIGSDHSALIQRALESGGPINLETGPSTYRHQGARRQSQGMLKILVILPKMHFVNQKCCMPFFFIEKSNRKFITY